MLNVSACTLSEVRTLSSASRPKDANVAALACGRARAAALAFPFYGFSCGFSVGLDLAWCSLSQKVFNKISATLSVFAWKVLGIVLALPGYSRPLRSYGIAIAYRISW